MQETKSMFLLLMIFSSICRFLEDLQALQKFHMQKLCQLFAQLLAY